MKLFEVAPSSDFHHRVTSENENENENNGLNHVYSVKDRVE